MQSDEDPHGLDGSSCRWHSVRTMDGRMGPRPDRRRFRDACAAARSPTVLPEIPQGADWGEWIVAQRRALLRAGVSSEAADADLHFVMFAPVGRRPLDRRCFLDACAVERLQMLLPESVAQDAHPWELIVGRLNYAHVACVKDVGKMLAVWRTEITGAVAC